MIFKCLTIWKTSARNGKNARKENIQCEYLLSQRMKQQISIYEWDIFNAKTNWEWSQCIYVNIGLQRIVIKGPQPKVSPTFSDRTSRTTEESIEENEAMSSGWHLTNGNGIIEIKSKMKGARKGTRSKGTRSCQERTTSKPQETRQVTKALSVASVTP